MAGVAPPEVIGVLGLGSMGAGVAADLRARVLDAWRAKA